MHNRNEKSLWITKKPSTYKVSLYKITDRSKKYLFGTTHDLTENKE